MPNPYGSAHRARRRRLAPMVEAGMVRCARCGELIKPGEPLDLGHVDGSGKTLVQRHRAPKVQPRYGQAQEGAGAPLVTPVVNATGFLSAGTPAEARRRGQGKRLA